MQDGVYQTLVLSHSSHQETGGSQAPLPSDRAAVQEMRGMTRPPLQEGYYCPGSDEDDDDKLAEDEDDDNKLAEDKDDDDKLTEDEDDDDKLARDENDDDKLASIEFCSQRRGEEKRHTKPFNM